jgi:thiosulfate dehydrogenase (quinone) large subunit
MRLHIDQVVVSATMSKRRQKVTIGFRYLALLLRIVYGISWVMAGVTKISGMPGKLSWFRYPGTFLTSYLTDAIDKPNVPEFYRLFLEYFALRHVTAFNYAIPLAQILLGLCLILGIGILPAVFGALFMHINFILSGNMNLISLTLYTSAFAILIVRRQGIYLCSLDRRLGFESWLTGKATLLHSSSGASSKEASRYTTLSQ